MPSAEVGQTAGARLMRRLADRIARDGPIGVDAYMDACLHDPQDGYYATRPRLGAAGDFLTAPLVSQMFGELLGAWMADVWTQLGRPSRFRLVELGPGDGSMVVDALRAASGTPGLREALELVLLETSAPLRAAQSRTLSARWISRLEAVGDDVPVIILANEFLDCLPIRQAVAVSGGWRERRVGSDGRRGLAFVVSDAPITLPGSPPAGDVFEWSASARRWAANLAGLIARASGAALFIDYGGDGRGDTLQAVRGHRKEGPLEHPGQADLSARVDFARFLAAATGAQTLGPVAQGAFLRSLGLEARASALSRANPEHATKITRQVARLADPEQMGELFQVACIASAGLTLAGFA